MAFSSGFFNSKGLDRTYTAENFCDYLGSIICNGIQDNYGDCFKLTAASSGLKVTVGRGKAWINGHYFINDARYSIDLSEYVDESLPRYVGIAIYLDTTESVRSVTLKLFPGTPAEAPSLPSIPQDADHVRLLMYAVRWCVAKPDKRKSRKMTCPDFTDKLYELMHWDSKCRYKILGYKIEFEGETYYVFDLIVKETFREKPKKGEAIDETVDYKKGYYSEDIAGTFGVPVEEHKKLTQVTVENGYINVAMLTGDKKPVEIEQAGQQLTLDDNSATANSTGEVYPDVEEEVSDGEPIMGEC